VRPPGSRVPCSRVYIVQYCSAHACTLRRRVSHGSLSAGDGKCTTVPQALTPEAETKAASMSRACAKVFPTQVKDGLIFTWLQSGPEAYVESSMCVFLPLCA
jgi:hypothetical protein